jgi:hypothetical protein
VEQPVRDASQLRPEILSPTVIRTALRRTGVRVGSADSASPGDPDSHCPLRHPRRHRDHQICSISPITPSARYSQVSSGRPHPPISKPLCVKGGVLGAVVCLGSRRVGDA